jgi:hypothetical protein
MVPMLIMFKVSLVLVLNEVPLRRWEVQLHAFLTLLLDQGEWPTLHSGRLTSEKGPPIAIE